MASVLERKSIDQLRSVIGGLESTKTATVGAVFRPFIFLISAYPPVAGVPHSILRIL